jgi:hypothetical protein
MAAPIFQAIGRGYGARSILGAIGRKLPQYANTINTAYYTGYSANTILSRIASKADGKNYDPDLFLTEHEQVQKRDQSQKRKAAMQLVAAAGTAGAVAAGAYALMRRNRAIQPDEILPAPHQRKQIGGKQQLALPHNPQQAPQAQQPPPSQPIQPITMPQQQQQQEQQQAPQPTPPDLMKTVDLLKNLREDQRFRNIIEGGYDLPTTTSILRAAMPKQIAQILEKSEGGLERVVNDYTQYLKQANEQQKEMIEQNKPENFAEMTKSTIAQAPQEQTPVMQEFQKAQQQQAPAQSQQMPHQPIAEVAQQMIPPAPSKPLVSLKNGRIGEVESEKGPIAQVNINGKLHKEKTSALNREPPDVEQAVREVINSIPENMKSTAVQSMVHIPGLNIMISQFYDGKWAYYLDMPEDIYQSVALGTYQPKGQAVTGIGEYKPGVADSRGAGFHQEIKVNPKYSKENKGITWGYATNEYSLLHNIQGIIHKISKERYDENGKLIEPKAKKKDNLEKSSLQKESPNNKDQEKQPIPHPVKTQEKSEKWTEKDIEKAEYTYNPELGRNELKKPKTDEKAKADTKKKVEEKITRAGHPDITKKGLKEQKIYLQNQIAEVLGDRSLYGEKILFDVPGDGQFTIHNNEKALKQFLHEIDKRWPDKPIKESDVKKMILGDPIKVLARHKREREERERNKR